MHLIIGLGNPGEKYKKNRHNLGRIILEKFKEKNNFSVWTKDKIKKGLVSFGEVNKKNILLLEPETFMNESGLSVKTVVDGLESLQQMIVIYDDIDLPLGSFKISFGRSCGGHNGLDSIIKAVGTKEFIRIRVGISPVSLFGKIRKPKGESKVVKYVLSDFSKRELSTLEKVAVKVCDALEMLFDEGKEKTMNIFN